MNTDKIERMASYFLKHAANIIYTAVILDEESRSNLLSWFQEISGEEIHPKEFAHHMTIKFKPSEEEIESTPFNEKATLKIIGWASDERGQAVLVEPSIPSSNQFPHITVATNGVGPVYSNKLLENGYNEVQGPTLTGTVEAR